MISKNIFRIRRLAKGTFGLEIAHVPEGGSRLTADWKDGPEYATEREAEIAGRTLVDEQGDFLAGKTSHDSRYRWGGRVYTFKTIRGNCKRRVMHF